jgi:hypothetical protein
VSSISTETTRWRLYVGLPEAADPIAHLLDDEAAAEADFIATDLPVWTIHRTTKSHGE